MSLDNTNNCNIIAEILNSSNNIRNQIEFIWNSKDMFTSYKDGITFCFLLGYLSSKNCNLNNKEKLLNILLEFSTRNRTNEKDISDIILNLSSIINDNIKKDKMEYNNKNSSFSNLNDKRNIVENDINKKKSIDYKSINYEDKNNISNNIYSIGKNKTHNSIKLNEIDNYNQIDEENHINHKEKNEIQNNNNNNNINITNTNINDIKNYSNDGNKINIDYNSNININSEKDLLLNNSNNKNESSILGKKTSVFQNMKKCKICLEEFDENDILNYELECGCIIHYECFDQYIKNAVENNNVPILCPYCKIEIHPNLIYDSLNTNKHTDLMKKYEKFSMDNYLLNHKDNYSCCPTAGCEYIFFFEEGENRFLCPLCNKEYCLFCKDIWHKGLKCQEYQDSKDVKKLDDKFLNFVKGAHYKICPVCKIWVEKTKGCNNMKCRCGNNFCYKCGKVIPKHIHDCPCWKKRK